ncbi:MAG: hypothetical protein LUG45_05390 [Clostridiales bacterium]|nr:hypothetical protein [Clostridiales bacterium]
MAKNELNEEQMERVQKDVLDKLCGLPQAQFENAMLMVSMFLDGMAAQANLEAGKQ